MKNIKKLLLIPLLLIFGVFIQNASAVQTFTMAVTSPGTVAMGSNITLTFTAKDLGGITNGFDGYEGYINFDSSKLQYVSMSNAVTGWVNYPSAQTDKIKFLGYDDNPPTNAKSSDTKIMTVVFKALASTGSTNVTVTTIKGSTGAGAKIVANDTSHTITFGSATVPKSSDATLKGLTITGSGGGTRYSLSPTFSSGTTGYTVTVPNGVTGIDVSALTNDGKATVTVVGNTGFKVGTNNVTIKVTAEDGTTKTYTINVTREAPSDPGTNTPGTNDPGNNNTPGTNDPGNNNNNSGNTTTNTQIHNNTTVIVSKSSNNLLKVVKGLDGLELTPEKTDYNITVPFEVSSLDISAEAQHAKAKVVISNSKLSGLIVGETKSFTINVTAEDGSLRVYTFNVKRSKYTSNTGLKELTANYEDVLKRNPNSEDEFTLVVGSHVNDLNIKAIPVSEDATVKIKGNSYLKEGDNTYIIQVTDKNGFTKNYTLTVTKKKFNWLLNWWWLLLILATIIAILIILIYKNNKQKQLLDEIEEEEKILELKNKNLALEMENEIEKRMLMANAASNRIAQISMDERSSEDEMLENLLNDDSVSNVSKEYIISKDSDDEVEKEIKITKNYRKRK